MTEEEEFEFRHRYERETASPSVPLKIGREGFADAFRETFKASPKSSQNLAALGSFPRQLYEGAKQMFGKEDPAAITATKTLDELDPVRSTAGALGAVTLASLVPGGASIGGQALIGTGTGALMPAGTSEERLKNTAIGGGISAGGAIALKGVGSLAGKWLQGSKDQAAALASQNAVRDETIRLAQQEGLKIPRTVTGGGEVAEGLENLGMRGALAREFSRENQPVVNKIARREAGLAEDKAISEDSLKEAREVIAQPYKDVAAVSPKAAKALEDLKEARREAGEYWADYSRSQSKAALDSARKFDAKAMRHETEIEKEAVKATMGQSALASDLMQRLRDARVGLAKNYDVLAALNKGNGNVDAKVLGRMYDKRGEKGMTGGLATVGRASEAFGSYFNEGATGTSKAAGYGVAKPATALALGLGGYSASEHYGMGPWGGAAAVVPFLSGPARSIALSKMMQGAPEYTPGASVRLADLATNSPTMRRMFPVSAGITALEQE